MSGHGDGTSGVVSRGGRRRQWHCGHVDSSSVMMSKNESREILISVKMSKNESGAVDRSAKMSKKDSGVTESSVKMSKKESGTCPRRSVNTSKKESGTARRSVNMSKNESGVSPTSTKKSKNESTQKLWQSSTCGQHRHLRVARDAGCTREVGVRGCSSALLNLVKYNTQRARTATPRCLIQVLRIKRPQLTSDTPSVGA